MAKVIVRRDSIMGRAILRLMPLWLYRLTAEDVLALAKTKARR